MRIVTRAIIKCPYEDCGSDTSFMGELNNTYIHKGCALCERDIVVINEKEYTPEEAKTLEKHKT